MKTIKLVLLLSIPILISCNNVRFESPMPMDTANISTFNKQLIGNYYVTDSMLDDSSYNEHYFPEIYKTKDSVKTGVFNIDISKNTIRYTTIEKSYYDVTKLNMSNINTATVGVEGKSIVTKKTFGNYILIEKTDTAELVNIATKDILRAKDKCYYVNIQDDKDWLTVQLIPKKKGVLIVNMLKADELDNLPKNFEVTQESKSGFSSDAFIEDMNNEKFDYLVKHDYFKHMVTIKKY